METTVQSQSQIGAAEAARLQLVVMRLARRLRQQAPEGVTPSQLSALSSLDRHGAMTVGELATSERIRPPSMTRIVAGLEEGGLIERQRDERDRRCSRVSLTSKGRSFVERNRSRKTAYLVRLSRALKDEEATTLLAAAEILEKMLEGDA